MQKQIFAIAVILLLGSVVSAQTTDKAIEKIRTYYNDVAEKARLAETDEDQGSVGELVMNELEINKQNHQWRAVGIYRPRYKFFYKGGDTEEHMYPDQLVLVKTDRTVSNRSYHEEYLYSERGVLLFCFQKADGDEMTPAERRVYFSGVKAIRIVEDGKTRDRLSPGDKTTVKEIRGQSAKIKDVFLKSISL